jgi:Ribosomal Proteins L2, C-terminal domain
VPPRIGFSVRFNRLSASGHFEHCAGAIVRDLRIKVNEIGDRGCDAQSETAARTAIIAPQRIGAGDEVVSGVHVDVKPGNAMPLASIPVGTIVHNVEMKIGKGGALARSAGTYAQIVGRVESHVKPRLKSGEQRWVHGE